MRSFKGAVEVGAHAIETDLHISRDSVVVLSHVRPLWKYPNLMSLETFAHDYLGRQSEALLWPGGENH